MKPCGLEPLPLTFRHRAGVSPYTSAFAFAETCVFVKQSAGPFLCDPGSPGRRFSRSYAAILPSSLTRVLPFAWVFSTHLPVSVCGTATRTSSLRGFSWPPLQSLLARRLHHHALGSGSGFPCRLLRFARLAPHSTKRLTFVDASPLRSIRAVPDCSPVVHRLRLPASA